MAVGLSEINLETGKYVFSSGVWNESFMWAAAGFFRNLSAVFFEPQSGVISLAEWSEQYRLTCHNFDCLYLWRKEEDARGLGRATANNRRFLNVGELEPSAAWNYDTEFQSPHRVEVKVRTCTHLYAESQLTDGNMRAWVGTPLDNPRASAKSETPVISVVVRRQKLHGVKKSARHTTRETWATEFVAISQSSFVRNNGCGTFLKLSSLKYGRTWLLVFVFYTIIDQVWFLAEVYPREGP